MNDWSSGSLLQRCPFCAVTYGLERMNREVAAWMRGDLVGGSQYSQPPYIAMG